MRINSANIGMESARKYTSERNQRVRFSVKNQTGSLAELGDNALNNLLMSEEEEKGNEAAVDENAKNTLSDFRSRMNHTAEAGKTSIRDASDTWSKIRQECMRYLFELLFGNKKSQQTMEEEVRNIAAAQTQTVQSSLQSVTVTTTSLEVESLFYEKEETSFSTEGTVKTADGREISFQLELEMSRSFSAYYHANYEMQSVSMCDPLVINLDSNTATVSDQKFYFDLDADGKEDEISELESGSGYLALDLNGDGKINDGSELFGAKSGNGFADLAKYDSDGNGWIDEGDDIWDKLLIWTKDASGEDKLYHLEKKGVGAICLQNAQTDFSLNSSEDNRINGQIRKTGIFLYENGSVGTVQHLDLAT